MMPPINGPSAGPIKVPLKNHPMAVARSVCSSVNRSRAILAGSPSTDDSCRKGIGGLSFVSKHTKNPLLGRLQALKACATKMGLAYRLVNVSNDCIADDEKCCALESCQDSKDEK
jgi:hypothetical protein